MPRYDSPDAAEQAFYSAFEHCDPVAMATVWSTGTGVSCIHPGGPLLQGSEAVLHSWAQIFSQASPPETRFRVLQRHLTDELAIHTVEESIRPGGSTESPTRIIVLNIYRLDADGWRLMTHHATLPMLGQRQSQGAVH